MVGFADMLGTTTNAVSEDGPAVATTSTDEQSSQAGVAADHEHNLSFLEAVRSYPAAVAWSVFFSLGVIMAVRLA